MEQQIKPHRLFHLLRTNKKTLDTIVLDFLPTSSESKEIQSLYQMMRDYPSRGGKGFRGSLCLLWCELWGGKKEDALTTAAALELFQNWILIHDDIEDESDLRRGYPALHRKHGVPLSINAGDALHGKMWELLLTNQKRISADSAFEILKEFSVMLNETTEGQQIELSWSISGSWNIREQEYFTMVTKKSAWYTCIAPARLGTILAWKANHNGNEKDQVLQLIIEVGTAMGIAFQIVDDVLNLTASEAKYGKEILGDLFEGKRTLMMIHLLSKCQEREKNKVLSIMQKARSEKTVEEMEYVFNLMKQFGSIEYASQVAQDHAGKGLSLYDKLCTEHGLESSTAYETTRLLLEYLVKRDY